MEPPTASAGSMPFFTPLTPAGPSVSEGDSSTPLTMSNFPIKPLSLINTASSHSSFPTGASPISSPVTAVPTGSKLDR